MNNIKISVIVPVYNVEKYVSRCLDSLISQTMEEIEILVVDDASTDNSAKICDEYAKNDNRIKVFHQNENKGQSNARNLALKICQGEYIVFVDSDDWVSNDMCENMYNAAVESNAKMTIFDYIVVKSENIEEKRGFLGNEVTLENYFKHLTPGYLWNKIFHCSLKEKLIIDVNSGQAEDLCILLIMVSFFEKNSDICYVPSAYYYYMQRDDSSSNSDIFVKSYGIEDYFKSLKYILENHNKEYSEWVSYYCVQCLYWGINNPARKFFKADYVEFLQNEVTPYIIGNPNMRRYTSLLNDLTTNIIPRKIVYANFSNENFSKEKVYCIDSWKTNAPDYEFCLLTLENCDMETAPECVKTALSKKIYSFVEEYFVLKEIYRHGGIALNTEMALTKPLGDQRMHRTFFTYKDEHYLASEIWGSNRNELLLSKLLASYEEDSLYNDTFVGLAERIQLLLEREYKLIPKGISCFLLENVVKLYDANTLYKRVDENNVARKYSLLDKISYEKNEVTISCKDLKRIIANNTANNTKALNQVKKENVELKRQLNKEKENSAMYNAAYNNTINSTFWKLTEPLRKILDFIRRTRDE